MKPKKTPKKRASGNAREKRPVFVRIGTAVVRKDGAIEVELHDRVSAVTVHGPWTPSASKTEDDVPF